MCDIKDAWYQWRALAGKLLPVPLFSTYPTERTGKIVKFPRTRRRRWPRLLERNFNRTTSTWASIEMELTPWIDNGTSVPAWLFTQDVNQKPTDAETQTSMYHKCPRTAYGRTISQTAHAKERLFQNWIAFPEANNESLSASCFLLSCV